MIEMLQWPVALTGAYLMGSIPFGLLIGLSRGVDIRQHGSRNIGATNVGRVLGMRLGVLCFVLDAGKGALPVAISGSLMGVSGHAPDELPQHAIWLWLAVAAAALLGHMYSPWLGFRGGKGVATGFGGLVAMWPLLTLPAIAALLLWIVVLAALRYISVASMTAAASLPVSVLIIAVVRDADLAAHAPLLVVTIGLAAFVIVKHRANIGRLRDGSEPRLGA